MTTAQRAMWVENPLVDHSDTEDAGHDSDAVREKIIKAAAECFERFGLQRTIMEDVAKAAGVSRGTVYNHFKDKAGLVGAYMSAESVKTLAAAKERLDYSLPSVELLAQALLALVDASVAKEVFLAPGASGITAEVITASPLVVEKRRGFWYPILELIKERGDLREDLDLEDLVVWLLFVDLVLNMRRTALADTSEGVISYLEEFVMRPLLIG